MASKYGNQFVFGPHHYMIYKKVSSEKKSGENKNGIK
jgi:hypothetical protein